MQSTQNKKIQQKRMIKYFLDSAISIINDEGFKGVSLRKVADRAGYNSATLYNYFESLDHLLFFASLNYLKEYINSIEDYIKYSRTPMDNYLSIWFCFIDFSYRQPEVYSTLFFTKLEKEQEYYVEKYYEYFPLDLSKYPIEIQEMLKGVQIKERSRILLKPSIEEGLLTEEDSKIMDDIIVCVYETMLGKVRRGSISCEKAKLESRRFILRIIKDIGKYEEKIQLPLEITKFNIEDV